MTGPTDRMQYKDPPIEEALVEFRFVPRQEWDLTIPGKLHQHPGIRDLYQGRPRQQKVVQAALQTAPGQSPGFAVHEGVGRVQLVDLDAKRLISLGPDVLSINVLRPYEGWDRFSARIDAALSAYTEVAGVVEVSRIGVRYINRIVIPTTHFDLGTYFLSGPPSPPELPSQMAGFLTRVEYVYEDGCKLFLIHASIEAPEGTSAFLVDLDVVWEGKNSLPVKEVMAYVHDLHKREGAAFEAIITNETRSMFNAD